MSAKNKIALAVVIASAIGALAYYFAILGSEVALFERFPDIDPKIVVKAHRQFIKNTLKGKYADCPPETDEEHDKIFLEIVDQITNR